MFFGFSEMLLYLNLFKYLSATILSELPIKRSLLIFFNMHLCSQDIQLNLPSLSLCFQRNKQKRDKSNLQKGKLTTECCWGGRGRVMLPDHIFFCISPETRTKHLQECSQRQWLITMTSICPTDTVTKCPVNFPLV